MQDVVTEYCLHCAWFQNHVLHSECINKVVIANHPILFAIFYFSNLLNTMVLEKKNITLFSLFENTTHVPHAFKYRFLLFFQSLPFSFIPTRKMGNKKRETKLDISKQQRIWVPSSQVEYWVVFSSKFCFFGVAQPHRSTPVSLASLETIL